MPRFVLDGTCLHLPFQGAVHLHFDAPNLGESHAIIMGQRKATGLRISKAIVAILTLEAWETWFFSMFFAPTEERGKGSLQSQEHILKHLAINVLVLFSQLGLDFWQHAFLLRQGKGCGGAAAAQRS